MHKQYFENNIIPLFGLGSFQVCSSTTDLQIIFHMNIIWRCMQNKWQATWLCRSSSITNTSNVYPMITFSKASDRSTSTIQTVYILGCCRIIYGSLTVCCWKGEIIYLQRRECSMVHRRLTKIFLLGTPRVSHICAWEMFYSASLFNQDISSRDTGNITNMWGMFYNALSFNQDLSSWDMSHVMGYTGTACLMVHCAF